jgi:hypothetical protein
MTAPHKATPLQWQQVEDWVRRELRPLADRIAALEAAATCPHVVTSDEGTSYCGLAEQGNRQAILDSSPAPAGDLMQSVGAAICSIADCGDTPLNWAPEARAAILAVAGWLEHRKPGALQWAALLREEVERHD